MAEVAMLVPALLMLLFIGLYVQSSRLLRAAWKRERELSQMLTESQALVARWETIANGWKELAQKGQP